MKKILIILLLALSGCATQGSMQQSKNPTVMIKAEKKAVMDKIVQWKIESGTMLKSSNEYMLVFEMPIDNMMASLMYGSRFKSTPDARITYNLSQQNEVTTVTGTFHIVTNANTGAETSKDRTSVVYKDMQSELDRLKTNLEK